MNTLTTRGLMCLGIMIGFHLTPSTRAEDNSILERYYQARRENFGAGVPHISLVASQQGVSDRTRILPSNSVRALSTRESGGAIRVRVQTGDLILRRVYRRVRPSAPAKDVVVPCGCPKPAPCACVNCQNAKKVAESHEPQQVAPINPVVNPEAIQVFDATTAGSIAPKAATSVETHVEKILNDASYLTIPSSAGQEAPDPRAEIQQLLDESVR